MPVCQNCKKSNRECERGVRLNFIDTKVEMPPYITPPGHDWQVNFQDESREIASEYKGGLGRYAALKPDDFDSRSDVPFDFGDTLGAPTLSHQSLPAILSYESGPNRYSESRPESLHSHSYSNSDSTYANTMAHATYGSIGPMMTPPRENNLLNDRDQTLYMQVFIEEVAIWMDSMDALKHVSINYSLQSSFSLTQTSFQSAFLSMPSHKSQ